MISLAGMGYSLKPSAPIHLKTTNIGMVIAIIRSPNPLPRSVKHGNNIIGSIVATLLLKKIGSTHIFTAYIGSPHNIVGSGNGNQGIIFPTVIIFPILVIGSPPEIGAPNNRSGFAVQLGQNGILEDKIAKRSIFNNCSSDNISGENNISIHPLNNYLLVHPKNHTMLNSEISI